MKLTLPHQLLFGYWGFTPFPWLMLLSSAQKDNKALIAHEQCHQDQQRRDGVFRFWWRYLTGTHRFSYELEAYKVWLKHKPEDLHIVSFWLAHNYGLNITAQEAQIMLTS